MRAAAEIDAAVARGDDPGVVGRRADGREGARRGRGLARHARVDALQGRDRRPRPPPRRRGCGPRARCSSGSRRRPSSARRTGRARTCTARPATRGTRSARPAVRRAAPRPRSRSGMMPICTGSDGGGSIRIPSAYSGPVRLQDRASAASATPATSTAASRRCPVRCAARCATRRATSTRSRVRPTSTPRRCRARRARTRTRSSRATRPRSCAASAPAWSSTLGFAVCDPEVEKLSHEAALALCADAGIELVDVDVHFPRPGGRGASSRPSTPSANYLDAYRGQLGRRHAGVARRAARRSTAQRRTS